MEKTRALLSDIAATLKEYEAERLASSEAIERRLHDIEARLNAIESHLLSRGGEGDLFAEEGNPDIAADEIAEEEMAEELTPEERERVEAEEVALEHRLEEEEEQRLREEEERAEERTRLDDDTAFELSRGQALEEAQEDDSEEDAGSITEEDKKNGSVDERSYSTGDRSYSEYNHRRRRDWYDWEVDFAGEPVEDLVSSLDPEDKMLFIRTLFRGDKHTFETLLSSINSSAKSFKELVKYLREEYPHWDEESPVVYKFYMHIRRKIQ